MSTLTFLPWTRAGAAAAVNAAGTVMGANRAAVQVGLTVTKKLDDGTTSTLKAAGGQAGSPSASVSMPMLGPGDVLGLAPGQVIRTEPADGATGVLTTVFPAVEFGEATLPWLFTPAAENVGWPGSTAPPAGSHRLMPWICLVVVPDSDGITLDPSARTLTIGGSADARQELPDLADAWAWAHVQYAGSLAADATTAASTLATSPGAVLSRLLCPRQLAGHTRYLACVVPTFMAGRIAGLGGSPDPTAQAGPAWDVHGAEASLTLPVYYSFSFTTGTSGDFLSLAQLLVHPPQVSAVPGAGLGPITLTVSVPGSASPPVRLAMPGMLQPASLTSPPEPASFASVRQWLQGAITPSSADPLPELLPTPYGAAQAGIRPADLAANFAQLPAWFTALNCDPRLRAAAALGRRVVAAQREELLAAAWAQVEQAQQANALLARAQLARAVGERQSARHLSAPGSLPSAPGSVPSAADSLRFLRLTSPHASRVQVIAGEVVGSIWSVVRDPSADPKLAAVTSAAYRRIGRPRGPHARNTAAPTAPRILIPPSQLTPGSLPFSPGQMVPTRILADRLSLPAATAARAGSQQDPLRGFAPQVSFRAGMITPLVRLDPDALLPGAAAIPPNTALTLQVNPLPIAAYLVGLNTEISRLLLWRGVPADPRATPFTYFWDQRGQAGGPPDITPIAGWQPGATLSAQVTGDVGGIVLAVRADLLRRYPTTAVYATKAKGSPTHTFDISIPANNDQPAFTAMLPPDLRLFGFPDISVQAAIGGSGNPGYFFIFQEQVTETGFGTDAMTTAGVTAPAGNYWTSASLAPLTQQPAPQPPVHAGGIASAVRMLPVLVAIHARALLPAGG
jgi:hypothetical protein